MDSVTLRYAGDDGAINKYLAPFNIVRGFERPDKIAFWPPVINEVCDGTKRTEFRGFRRVISIDFGVLDDDNFYEYLLSWMRNNTRSVYLGMTAGREEEIIVASDVAEYEAQWLNSCVLGRKFVLPVIENVIRTAWSDYTPASGIDYMYCKKRVKIEGTQAAPETFTTNADKLVVMETGYAFPAISLLSWVVTVKATALQDCKVNVVGDVENYGTNLRFELAMSDAGNAAPDGFYYADIEILLQARP